MKIEKKKEKNKNKKKDKENIIKIFFDKIKNKWLKEKIFTTILVSIIIGIFIILNIVLDKINIKAIDITQDKIYSLSDKSKELVKDIEKKINIYFFGFEEEERVVRIAKQYKEINTNITAEIIDIIARKDIAEKYGIDSTEDIGIIVETEDDYKVLSLEEIFEFDTATFETIDHSEEKITNAIMDLIIENKSQAYFLSGHGEYHVNQGIEAIAAKIYNEQYDINILDFLQVETIPENCDILIIPTPEDDFKEKETEEIIKYINNGGNILWLEDPTIEEKQTPNKDKILDCYGVRFSEGVILETDSSKIILNNQELIVPQQDTHPITEKLDKSKMIVLAYAGKLEIKTDEELDLLGVEVKPILKTTQTSFLRTNLDITDTKLTEEDEKGGFIISAEFTKKLENEKESKMIAISNNLFVSDQTITIQNQAVNMATVGNNSNFVLNAVKYLTNKESAIEIAKVDSSVPYTATQLEDTIIKIIITILPLSIFAIGIIVWQKRKRQS